MKPVIKIKAGSLREAIWWIFRFVLLLIIAFLILRVYSINLFFVTVSGGVLFLIAILISEERIEANEDFLIISKLFCFNLFEKKKVIRIDKMKNVVVAGNLNLQNSLIDAIIPKGGSPGGSSFNELRIIYKENDSVDYFQTMIYLEKLTVLETILNELIQEKGKPNSFSQPIYRDE